MLSGIALTFVYTWLFNRTEGSVLLAILAHTSVDAFNPSEFFLAPIVRGASNLPFLIAFGPVAVLLVVFTRGRLGYQDYLREAGAAPQRTHAREHRHPPAAKFEVRIMIKANRTLEASANAASR